MKDEEIVEYCRRLIVANLNQYSDKSHIAVEIFELSDKHNKKLLKAHCEGIIKLLQKCVKIIDATEKE